MGREAEADCSFAGRRGAAKVLLESTEIILRGAIKARIARQSITAIKILGDDLVLQTRDGLLSLTLGHKQALSWAAALAKPPPTLAQKMGIRPDKPVLLIGPITDAALVAAVATKPEGSGPPAMLIAELHDNTMLDQVMPRLNQYPDAAFWGITAKGKVSVFGDQDLRMIMRAHGYIDTKSCAVSDLMTATRYAQRKNPAQVGTSGCCARCLGA